MTESAGETEFTLLADNAPVMIWRADTTSACDWFNRPWLEFTGRTLEEELGFGWANRVHREDYERCLSIYREAFAARREFTMDYRLQRHDGAWRWIQDHGRPFRRNGDFAGYFGSCVDITEMKQALEEREALMQELQHRVRNNAQATASFLGLQASRSNNPEVAGALRGAAARVLLASLVQDRIFRHTGSDRLDLAPELAAAITAAFELGKRPGLRLETALEGPVAVPVRRAAPIALMVNELVTNALRHGFPGGRTGRLKVSMHRLGAAEAEILVEDDGIGFTGLDPAAGTPTGLGLHLAERLARQARARLEFEAGPGTRARLRFATTGD